MQRLSPALLLVFSGFLLAPSSAQAVPMLFTGSGTGADGVTLSASALFSISGNTLTVTLTNTGDSSGTAGTDVPANQLTGVFFDLPTGITLTPTSATIAAGDLVQASSCDTGLCSSSTTNVGGEFIYGTGTFSGHDGNSGISSSGYISTGTMFGPTDLDSPTAPNGINFAIIADQTATNHFNPNGGVGGLSSEPLIEGSVVFTLTISGGTLLESQISNVSFQYGTAITESHFGSGGGSGAGQTVPEPVTLLLLAPGLLAAARRMRRRPEAIR
jgi:hypothetical protein